MTLLSRLVDAIRTGWRTAERPDPPHAAIFVLPSDGRNRLPQQFDWLVERLVDNRVLEEALRCSVAALHVRPARFYISATSDDDEADTAWRLTWAVIGTRDQAEEAAVVVGRLPLSMPASAPIVSRRMNVVSHQHMLAQRHLGRWGWRLHWTRLCIRAAWAGKPLPRHPATPRGRLQWIQESGWTGCLLTEDEAQLFGGLELVAGSEAADDAAGVG